METVLAILLTIFCVSLIVIIVSFAVITFVVAFMAIKTFIEELL